MSTRAAAIGGVEGSDAPVVRGRAKRVGDDVVEGWFEQAGAVERAAAVCGGTDCESNPVRTKCADAELGVEELTDVADEVV